MICQAITTGGAISADWTLVAAFGIIGFLIVVLATIVSRHVINSLDAITAKIEGHDLRLTDLEKQDIRHDAELKAIRESKNETLDKIFNTLEMLKGG